MVDANWYLEESHLALKSDTEVAARLGTRAFTQPLLQAGVFGKVPAQAIVNANGLVSRDMPVSEAMVVNAHQVIKTAGQVLNSIFSQPHYTLFHLNNGAPVTRAEKAADIGWQASALPYTVLSEEMPDLREPNELLTPVRVLSVGEIRAKSPFLRSGLEHLQKFQQLVIIPPLTVAKSIKPVDQDQPLPLIGIRLGGDQAELDTDTNNIASGLLFGLASRAVVRLSHDPKMPFPLVRPRDAVYAGWIDDAILNRHS